MIKLTSTVIQHSDKYLDKLSVCPLVSNLVIEDGKYNYTVPNYSFCKHIDGYLVIAVKNLNNAQNQVFCYEINTQNYKTCNSYKLEILTKKETKEELKTLHRLTSQNIKALQQLSLTLDAIKHLL